jgi:PAP2 superfamily
MPSESMTVDVGSLRPALDVSAGDGVVLRARAEGRGSATSAAWQQVRRSARAHSVFAALVVLYVAVGWLVSQATTIPVPFAPALYSTRLLLITAAFLFVAGTVYVVYAMVVIRPRQLVRYLGDALRHRILTVERLAMVLPVFLLLPVMMSTFTYFKFLIPFLQPFEFDARFAQWDRILHFGYEPWELLQPIFGYPMASAVVNFIYHLWLFVMFSVLLWQTFSLSRPRLRMRYFISFVLMWILLGNVAATLLSSAGPVYYGRITGLADPFAPLMAYLHQASQTAWLPALDVQDMLWRAYADQDLGIGSGISAMPSMHVAISVSFVFLGFAVRRWLGVLFSIFAAAILIGSVHLGWHYAIDGYVAIVGAWVIWWSVGWVLDRPAVVRLLWGGTPTPIP